MVFDIGFLVLLIVCIVFGYQRGLVSMILSIGAVAVALVLAMFITYKWQLIAYPPFGFWIQVFILFLIIGGIMRQFIDMVHFESIVLVGFASRLLGGALYGLIFAVVTFFVVLAVLTVAPTFLNVQFPNSVVIAWIAEFWQKINASGGLQNIPNILQQGRKIASL